MDRLHLNGDRTTSSNYKLGHEFSSVVGVHCLVSNLDGLTFDYWCEGFLCLIVEPLVLWLGVVTSSQLKLGKKAIYARILIGS